jgi:hypothetical protein
LNLERGTLVGTTFHDEPVETRSFEKRMERPERNRSLTERSALGRDSLDDDRIVLERHDLGVETLGTILGESRSVADRQWKSLMARAEFGRDPARGENRLGRKSSVVTTRFIGSVGITTGGDQRCHRNPDHSRRAETK